MKSSRRRCARSSGLQPSGTSAFSRRVICRHSRATGRIPGHNSTTLAHWVQSSSAPTSCLGSIGTRCTRAHRTWTERRSCSSSRTATVPAVTSTCSSTSSGCGSKTCWSRTADAASSARHWRMCMHPATLHRHEPLRRARGAWGIGSIMAMLLAVVVATPIAAVSAQLTPDSSGYLTTADGARLFYEIHGHGRDTVIVPAGALLAPHLAMLRDHLTLVFYDPRGRGQSDWIADPKRLTMGHEVRDLEAVRAGLGISRAGVIGFSYLGLVTALYAADHPDRVTRLAQLGTLAPDELKIGRASCRARV